MNKKIMGRVAGMWIVIGLVWFLSRGTTGPVESGSGPEVDNGGAASGGVSGRGDPRGTHEGDPGEDVATRFQLFFSGAMEGWVKPCG